jgi:hypothetical protein
MEMTTTRRLKILLAAAAFAVTPAIADQATALTLGLIQQNANSSARNIAIGSAKASGEDSGNLASGNAINGPALGGKAFNFSYGGWELGVEQDASASAGNGALARATAEGTDSRNILSGNAINGPAIGGTAVNFNAPYGEGLFDPPPPDGPPTDSLEEPPIGDLSDIPPADLHTTLAQMDDRDVDAFQNSCWKVVREEWLYDVNTIRVCRVVMGL